MSKSRVFTQAELDEMGRRTVDLICEAIDAGDKERAKKLSHRMMREFQSMHDLYMDWVTAMLSYIYEHYGDGALYEAMYQSCSTWWKPIAEQYESTQGFRHKVKMFARGVRTHFQPMKIEEDDKKVCFTLMPCGTGERIFKEGGYKSPKNFSVIKKPQTLTYDRPNCPIYCAHESILELLPIEWGGYPVWACFPPDGFTTGGCRFCIYKDRRDIPEEVYTRVGKKKPEC